LASHAKVARLTTLPKALSAFFHSALEGQQLARPQSGRRDSQRLFPLQHKLPHVVEEVGAVDVSLGINRDPFRQA
jgi:hypothetical protein